MIAGLLLLVGSATTFHILPGAMLEVPPGGAHAGYRTTGYATCDAGRPSIHLAGGAASLPETLAHELAHAADCLDDGAFNGSPLPASAVLRSSHPHCLENAAERYACWVVESGSVGLVRGADDERLVRLLEPVQRDR